MKKTIKHAFTLQFSITVREIDICVNEIQKSLQLIVEIIVSWIIFNRHVKSFWNKQCNTTIKNTRKFHYLWSVSRDSHDLKFYMNINDRKQKIIQKTKRVNFRQKIEKIVKTSTNLWRFAKWTKNKNHQLKEILKMLILKFNDLTIEIFNEKAKMFKKYLLFDVVVDRAWRLFEIVLFSFDWMFFQHNETKNAENYQTNYFR
jgi:hypothetical protein